MEEYLIYFFFRLPGALILCIVSGFKYKIGNIATNKGENKKETIISLIIWVAILLTFYIVNN